MNPIEPITIRYASDDDRSRVDRLATVDSSDRLHGEVLLAEVGGELWAALETGSGRVVADPFRASAQLATLLRLHGRREPAPRARLRLRLPSLRAA
jgi:hypothetical protein